MGAPLSTRERILAVAHSLFQQYGFGRVGVDTIAATAGVTKRTLYHYFRSKDDLLAEVADIQSALCVSHLRKGEMPEDAGAFVEGLFREIAGPHAIAPRLAAVAAWLSPVLLGCGRLRHAGRAALDRAAARPSLL